LANLPTFPYNKLPFDMPVPLIQPVGLIPQGEVCHFEHYLLT